MKKFLRRTLSLLLSLSLVSSLAVTAAASEALGEDLTTQETLLNQETQLSTNVFWSTAYSDLRTENLITYTPNDDVTPIVTYGDTLTACSTLTTAAKRLEGEGYRVVAGINGDFFNFGTGLPIGLVVTEGQLRSSDGGYYAIGFLEDGSAVLGKPGLKVTADLGYQVDDGYGTLTRVVRQLSGVNKARVSSGGIYLYTYDFNAKHTTGNTEPGVDVVCTVEDGELAIGGALTLTVEQVVEATAATAIAPDQVVLSVNLQSNSFYIDALRNLPVGSTVTVSAEAADERWNEVRYALGALYSLVEDGAVVSGLPSGADPRTAVGQKRDGTLVFYTIDGRKSGHSIGATLQQVAQRLIELGCETALCLDGGGSTTLTVTEPDDTAAQTINTPSGGSERSVSNQIFLVADSEPSGKLSHFYVKADSQYVLAGSKVNISAAAVDTNFIPMEDARFDLEADDGDLDGNVLLTPDYGCDITVTADHRGKTGSTVVHVIETPDDVAIRGGDNSILTALTAVPGSTVQLRATAAYQHMPLKADNAAFRWSVDGGVGTITADGQFTATAPGTGTITVSAGGKRVSIPVTVSKLALNVVEDFESARTVFDGNGTGGLTFTRTTAADAVRYGRTAGRLDYTLDAGTGYAAQWLSDASTDIDNRIYTSLSMWVYGDGSGNQLELVYSDSFGDTLTRTVTTLDFSGWRQVSVSTQGDGFALLGFRVSAGESVTYDDGFGTIIVEYPSTTRTGTVYIDQIVASYNGIMDSAVPTVTLSTNGLTLTAAISDDVDGVLPREAVTVTWDGKAQDFTYNTSTGTLTTPLISDGNPHRVTITARDASGNIGRASYDVPVAADWTPVFTDTRDYWAAAYVDFLYQSGITTGYADGTFRPNDNITRAQFSVMLYRYLGLEESKYADVTLPFADLKSIPDYALPAIRALYTEGVINGSTGKDGRLYFNPGASLTRAQAATMIGRTQEKGYAAAALTFSDSAKIPAYAAYYIQTMAAQGIIGGYADGTFRPGNNITRGQMAKILYNLL
ncbi:S-layer homology domain-containing protein [Dysosmobacter sp. Sow4_B12]|uniref:S-layer homology domain-containing protein n=1 Tax=Dysosmobacter sp. Sow4_B12 TaxID=3438777 RepID=UPI003F92039A